jgi:SAM-dependent methyltransferase
MNPDGDYWGVRTPSRRSFRSFLKNDRFISSIFNLRAGTEGFLKRELARIRERSNLEKVKILDIACGWGVSFASLPEMEFYGVDIEGFPRDVALSNGYEDARSYINDLTVPYDDNLFDACTILNLNAHVSDDLYAKLLEQARRKLKKDGELLIVAELNNHGISYKLMRSIDNNRFDRMVKGMDHINFVFESDFDAFIERQGFEIVTKTTIIGNILPFFHYTSWAVNQSPYDALRYPAFAVDMLNSLFDGALTVVGLGGRGRRFNVGYVLRVSE